MLQALLDYSRQQEEGAVATLQQVRGDTHTYIYNIFIYRYRYIHAPGTTRLLETAEGGGRSRAPAGARGEVCLHTHIDINR